MRKLRQLMPCLWQPQSGMVLSVALIFYGLFIYDLPHTLVIGDEIAYLHQAIALAHGQSTLTWPSPLSEDGQPMVAFQYPLGNALFISLFVLIFGSSKAFLAGGTALLLAFYVQIKTLKNQEYPAFIALLTFIFPVNALLGHTLMSDIPALLHSSLFVYWLSQRTDTPRRNLWLGFLAGSSLLWREPHFVLSFFPILGQILRGARP